VTERLWLNFSSFKTVYLFIHSFL